MTQTLETPLARREEAPQQTAVARRYEPMAPIGSVGGLKGLLETQKSGIAMALPKHVTAERLIKTMLVAVNRNPDILKCTQASVLETINRAAELGLDLSGTLGEAYPVPFNNKVKGPDGREFYAMQLQLIIGYRGLEKLAWQSGDVEAIDAEVVCIHDKFEFRKGTEVYVNWSPNLTGDRGEVIGAYACVKMKSGGKLARFLSKQDIEKIRNSSKSANSPAWRNWWDEMARKCALKRTLKDAPLSTEKFVKAMEIDHEDHALADVLSVERTERSTSNLLNKIKGNGDHDEAAGGSVASEPEPGPPVGEDSAPPAPGEGEKIDKETGEVSGAVLTDTLPDPTPDEGWLMLQIIQRRPAHLTVEQAIDHVSNRLKTWLPKPWSQLARSSQESKFNAVVGGKFEWPKAPPAE